jgi:hypothetical protein
VDRLLRTLASRSLRRGLAGEPVFLALAIGVWLVRRARKAGPEIIWSGPVRPGQRLTVTTTDPAAGGSDKG